jgi:hypothetical protein
MDIVTQNPEYKLLFLKAIKLGMLYGKSDKVSFYEDKINNEIQQLMENNISQEKPLNISQQEPEKQKKNDEQRKNNDMNIKKYDLLILNLENQRNTLVQYIQQLSANYEINHSKINFLKSGIENITKEIEKNKTLRQSLNPISTTPNIKKNIIEVKNKEPGLTNELQETFSKISEIISLK